MTIVALNDKPTSLDRKEKIVIGSILLAISFFTLLDVFEDFTEGASLGHIVPEIIIVLLTTAISFYLFLRFARIKQDFLKEAILASNLASASAEEWKSRTAEIKKGISDAVSHQLRSWGLTEAEQEIAFLLIKGMSVNEIAAIRSTSQQTTRQQASIIYKKSNLSGRAQLSAFFIEDLFLGINYPAGSSEVINGKI